MKFFPEKGKAINKPVSKDLKKDEEKFKILTKEECINYFNPPLNMNYTVENVLVRTFENRIDVIKTRADNLNKLKKDKIKLLTENAQLTNKMIELLK